jgi:hypothetical protein
MCVIIKFFQLRLAQFPVGETFVHVESINKNSTNSAISQTFHCGLANMREICVAEVVMVQYNFFFASTL